MEHRKRSMLQHKVASSILLKIVMAKKKKKLLQNRGNNDRSIVTALATEAMEALKKREVQPVLKNVRKRTILNEDEALIF